MIPVKLALSNFTSYGSEPQELDFTKFHIAAISGSNGAGKSSLLDAITWCVWGTSRLGDNSDSLVRLGQAQMWVEFSFQLDSHIFTIKRTRSLKSGGSTSLELTANLHNLTEGTIKATQQKIVDILRLTYETFVNSAFIRQGHADEFTTKGATDRKRILADILGLSHYDVLEEKAKEKSKNLQTKSQLLDYQLLEIEAELSQKEERQKQLSQAEKAAKEVESQLKTVESEIKAVESEREMFNIKRQSLLEKQQRVELVKKELADLKLQIDLKEKSKLEYQQILDRKEDIETNYLKLQKLQAEKKTLDSKRSELIKIKDEWSALLKTVNEREEKRALAIGDLKIPVIELQAKNEKLQQEVDHLKTHQDSCPTCGQEIDDKKNQEITQKNQAVILENKKAIDELEAKIKKYEAVEFDEQKAANQKGVLVKKLEEETKEYSEISTSIFSLEKYHEAYSKLQQAQTAVKTQTEAIFDLQTIYQNKKTQITDTSGEAELLQSLEKKLEEIKKQLEGKLAVKEQLASKALQLHGTVGASKALVDKAQQLETLQKEKLGDKSKMQKEKKIFDELSLAFGKKGIQAMIIETAIPEIEEETNRLLDKLTEGRMRVALVTQKETKTKVAGTGGKGIVETLDIVISDEMGERPYEAYSGGEQFRVNLAMRLALSKLLTNRAGSKLQFLVVDEGFGTQDTQGISRIIEALNAIQNEFEKIVVITHLDELKEEFPTRIEVTKDRTGSIFESITA